LFGIDLLTPVPLEYGQKIWPGKKHIGGAVRAMLQFGGSSGLRTESGNFYSLPFPTVNNAPTLVGTRSYSLFIWVEDCIIPSPSMFGCMDPKACNFDPEAQLESGNCIGGQINYEGSDQIQYNGGDNPHAFDQQWVTEGNILCGKLVSTIDGGNPIEIGLIHGVNTNPVQAAIYSSYDGLPYELLCVSETKTPNPLALDGMDTTYFDIPELAFISAESDFWIVAKISEDVGLNILNLPVADGMRFTVSNFEFANSLPEVFEPGFFPEIQSGDFGLFAKFRNCEGDGCKNPGACNYDSLAVYHNASCILPDGCTNPNAENYNPSALCDDGTCILHCPADVNNDLTVNSGDLLEILADLGCLQPDVCIDVNGDGNTDTNDILFFLSNFGLNCN